MNTAKDKKAIKDAINKRFSTAVELLLQEDNKLTKAKIAETLGSNSQSFTEILGNRQYVQLDILYRFFIEYGFNPEWIFLGKEPMRGFLQAQNPPRNGEILTVSGSYNTQTPVSTEVNASPNESPTASPTHKKQQKQHNYQGISEGSMAVAEEVLAYESQGVRVIADMNEYHTELLNRIIRLERIADENNQLLKKRGGTVKGKDLL